MKENKIVLWGKSEEHDAIAETLINKKRIYQAKQNYPELIVEDIIGLLKNCPQNGCTEDWLRNVLYAILLKRGVNKWLFVRKLLIRLKKVYQYKIRNLQLILQEDKRKRDELIQSIADITGKTDIHKLKKCLNLKPGALKDGLREHEYWQLRGELKAYCEIRNELQLLCNTPRWIIWNYKRVGLIDFAGVRPSFRKKWNDLFIKLYSIKFPK